MFRGLTFYHKLLMAQLHTSVCRLQHFFIVLPCQKLSLSFKWFPKISRKMVLEGSIHDLL